MVIPVLKHVSSPDLAMGELPPDPGDCAVVCHAEIGPDHGTGAEEFSFVVATPRHFLRKPAVRWGHGYLLMNTFSWQEVERALDQHLTQCRRPTWPQVVAQLREYLRWEFEQFQP